MYFFFERVARSLECFIFLPLNYVISYCFYAVTCFQKSVDCMYCTLEYCTNSFFGLFRNLTAVPSVQNHFQRQWVEISINVVIQEKSIRTLQF